MCLRDKMYKFEGTEKHTWSSFKGGHSFVFSPLFTLVPLNKIQITFLSHLYQIKALLTEKKRAFRSVSKKELRAVQKRLRWKI